MATMPPGLGLPERGRVAYAVVRGEEPQVFVAENAAVLDRVLATELVARSAPGQLSHAGVLSAVRVALLEERWADALVAWMDAVDLVVDVYDDEPVWTEARLDADRASFEIRVAPLFSD